MLKEERSRKRVTALKPKVRCPVNACPCERYDLYVCFSEWDGRRYRALSVYRNAGSRWYWMY